MPGDLLPLASDALAEVRASAARLIATAQPANAVFMLARLASDEEWFIRLRAVVGLGELRDFYGMRILVSALCDANRLVRLRAASALTRFDGEEGNIFLLTMQTHDTYAMQALVSEMERSGKISSLVDALADVEIQKFIEPALLAALHGGSSRMLLGLWLHHRNQRVRHRLGLLLAGSGDVELLKHLEQVELSIATPRQKHLLRWLVARLKQNTQSQPQQPVAAA